MNLILAPSQESLFCGQISEQLLTCFQDSTTLIINTCLKTPAINLNSSLPLDNSQPCFALERLIKNACYTLTLDHRLFFESGELFTERLNSSEKHCDPFSTSLVELCSSKKLRVKGVVILGGYDKGAVMAVIDKNATAVWVESIDNQPKLYLPRHQAVPKNTIIASIAKYRSPSTPPLQKIPKPASKSPIVFEQNSYTKLLSWLRSETKIDFSCYREKWLLDCIKTRCENLNITQFSQYLNLCSANSNEAHYFLSGLREVIENKSTTKLLFNQLKELISTSLDHSSDSVESTRVWIPGCGSSKETLVFLTAWKTVCIEAGIHKHCQVFASDITHDACHSKRYLVSHQEIDELAQFSQIYDWTYPEANKFFFPELINNVMRVHHNLTQHPAFPNLDIIICRNTLSLFKDTIRENILTAFHNSLTEKGALLLDEDEITIKEIAKNNFNETSGGFYLKKSRSKKNKNMAYQKMILPERPAYNFAPPIDYILRHHKRINRYTKHSKVIDQIVDQHMTPGFLLNEKYEIEHLIGDTSRLFPLIDQANISKDIRNRLLPELKTFLIPKIKELFNFPTSYSATFTTVKTETTDPLHLTIKLCHYQIQEQIGETNTTTPYCLILFEKREDAKRKDISSTTQLSLEKQKKSRQPNTQAQLRDDERKSLESRYDELLVCFNQLSSLYDKLSQKYEEAIEKIQPP